MSIKLRPDGRNFGTSPQAVSFATASVITLIFLSFTGGADGAQPFGALVRVSAGNLYGTTWDPATGYNYGTVYKLDPSGTKTSLHAFTGSPPMGQLRSGR
jgi:uncharacterized repeat protein (TIGR03803 family)